ncbi:MAG: Tim44/TimA family putative adaptor protein [Alphaproteobacteria bacterium]
MLNLFDFLIIGLFIVIVISLYGILKPENAKNNKNSDIAANQQFKKNFVKSILELKDKRIVNEVMQQLLKEHINERTAELSKLDKDFNPETFLDNSKKTFEKITKYMELKDRKNLKPLVTENIYNLFDEQIKEIEKKEQTLITEIVRFKKIIMTDIIIEHKLAKIVIEYTTEQCAFIKDKAGKVIKGDDNQLETMKDILVFSRDYAKKNSNWLLSETIEA